MLQDGETVTVFNISGNKYRFITAVRYRKKAEYDRTVEVAKKLSLYELNDDQEKYVDTLCALIQAYEDQNPFD